MRRAIFTIILLTCVCCSLSAQFRSTRNDVSGVKQDGLVTGPPGSETSQVAAGDSTAVVDSLQGFSLRKLFRGYARRDTLTPAYMLLGTAILPGAAQIYNRDYWKIPIIYAGIGAGVYGGIWANRQYQQTGDMKFKYISTASFIAAGAFYWGQLLDGVVCYKTSVKVPVPAKSTLYSLLLPGLGQAYNGDWWKIPIWTGGLVACGYFYHFNDMQYRRFRWITQMDRNNADTGYIGAITASQAETYRDLYRRWRDYSILATIIVYALNVIDANVFAYMSDFEVSDNLASLEIKPTVITPITPTYAWQNNVVGSNALGLNLQLTF